MGILDRFSDIIKANINDLLDKAEDPAKMVDQYLRNVSDSLTEVKKETAGVMAEETRTKRLLDENTAGIVRYDELARTALQAGSEDDARTVLTKKQQLEAKGVGLEEAYAVACENALRMRQLHDKLVEDLELLNSRRDAIKAKIAVAKTQDTVNTIASGSDRAAGALDAFNLMEEKADRMLDRAIATSELNRQPVDAVAAIEEKYADAGSAAAVDAELARLKEELGL